MNKLEKAQAQLNGIGIDTKIENDHLYVCVEFTELQLADFEVEFRAKVFDEEQGYYTED